MKVQLDDDTTFSTFIDKKRQTRRSDIKLKPRNKDVLDPRADKFSPEPVRRAVTKKAARRKARKPAVVESDSESMSDDAPYEDAPFEEAFIYKPREKIRPKRGGKVSKRGKM